MQEALRKLVDAELVYVHGIPPEASYTFKHALVRDAAYEALLKSRRKDLHRLVARTIDEKFSAFKEGHPEVLARHWTEAGEIEPAIAEWIRAAKAAEVRNAFTEALENYHQALRMLNLLPGSRERDIRELELRQSAAQMLYVTKRYFAPETTHAIEHAAELAQKTGNLAHLVTWAMRRWLAPFNSGELTIASAVADQTFELALREGSPRNIGMAHAMQTLTRHHCGDLAGAEQHFTAGLKFFDDPAFRQVPGAALWTFSVASYNACILGRADTARERMTQMTTFVNGNNPYDLAISKVAAADLANLLREFEQAEFLAKRALELSEKNDFPPEVGYSRCALGQARAQLGRATEGIVLIREGVAHLVERGAGLMINGHMASLAEAQEKEGAILEALETVEQALKANRGSLVHRPRALALRGELRRRLGATELGETDLREAIALVQKMGAKTWELRATMSLARLLRDTGRRDEARAMLADMYNWFTEGFDTRDLKDAKALLDELNG